MAFSRECIFRRERERGPRGRSIPEREEKYLESLERVKSALRERFQGGVLVFILGLLGTSQWLS